MAVQILEPTTLLTSENEVASIFSSDAVHFRLDDNQDRVITDGTGGTVNETLRLTDVMWEASDEAYLRLLHRYLEADLATSRWVRRRVSYIACHMLSTRRGNPAQYCDMYEKCMDELEAVKNNHFFVPGLTPHTVNTPSLANVVVDDWQARRKLRVQDDTGAGGSYADQFYDHGSWGFGYRGF